jgi:sec-independent protein translocase protein TatA
MWEAPWHWVVVALLAIALFGYKKLPDAARSLGRSLRIFKTEIKGMADDDRARDAAQPRDTAQPRPAVDAAAPEAEQPAASPAAQQQSPHPVPSGTDQPAARAD